MDRAVAAIERHWRAALATLLVLNGALLLYMGRELTFFYDEWEFILRDWGGGLHFMLLSHVGNIVFIPAGVYKVLFHLAGIGHYEPYRLLVVALHLIAGVLVFLLASRRVARAPALLACSLILFLGAAWEDLLWAFQVGYMLSIVAGLAAWLLLDRRERRSDAAAMLCLVVAVGSSSLGVALAAGVGVELLWEKRFSRLFVAVVPGLLYLLWYLGYGESQVTEESLIHAPAFIEDLAASAIGGLAGRGLDWGRPLALLAAAVLLVRLVRPPRVSARLVGLIATALVLWAITAMARSAISPPESSRYVYLGAVVVVLVGVELLAGVKIGARVLVLSAALVAFFAITGITDLREGSIRLRGISQTLTAELGALQLAAAYAPPEYRPDPTHAPPIAAGPYLHTVRSIGSSPAATPAEVAAANPEARAAADGVLRALEAPRLVAFAAGAHARFAAGPPDVSQLAGGTVSAQGPCVTFKRAGLAAMTGTLALPGAGVLIENKGPSAATVAVRRFGDEFVALQSPAPRGRAVLQAPPDAETSRVPWKVQLTVASPLQVCALSGGGTGA